MINKLNNNDSLERMIYDYHNSNKFPLDKRDKLIDELIKERDQLYKLLEESSNNNYQYDLCEEEDN